MPVYEYACTACGHPVEVMHSFTAPGPQACERCGAPMRKTLSTPAIVFKGSGWAKKDHRDKVHKASATSAAAAPKSEGEATATPASGEASGVAATPATAEGKSSAATTPAPAAASSSAPVAPKSTPASAD